MKVMTILGTRPEIIRLSLIIKKLDRYCDHTLMHTGQNFDVRLNDIFFKDLGLRQPDYYLGVRGETFAEQIGKILIEAGKVINEVRPERILILGDTNSGLASIIAKRLGISVFHMEAGNRCFDNRVPEEVNRRIIDHSSTVLLPYTANSRENLLREGIEPSRIYVTGNPIYEVIAGHKEMIDRGRILGELGIEPRKYFLVTMHREENVDIKARLAGIIEGLKLLHEKYGLPVVCSLHPRTRNRIQQFGLHIGDADIRLLEPLGFIDFVGLEKNALCLLTDSGTVQEECSIFRIPNVTIRDVTERPETIECGSNMLSGTDPDSIVRCVEVVLSEPHKWSPPAEYTAENVSTTVVKIVLGYDNNKTVKQ